jgi:hypothetical protein
VLRLERLRQPPLVLRAQGQPVEVGLRAQDDLRRSCDALDAPKHTILKDGVDTGVLRRLEPGERACGRVGPTRREALLVQEPFAFDAQNPRLAQHAGHRPQRHAHLERLWLGPRERDAGVRGTP